METEKYEKETKGVMYFGPGTHRPKDLPNNQIRIPSNTTVYLAPGAVVKAKLVVDKAENVRIIGRGIIDHAVRGIEITDSKNIWIDGITVVNPDHYTVFGGGSTGITRTTAIMPVHVYGKPCDTDRIQAIADKYGLKVIYDAAHAFGVKVNGESILNAGDISTLSFHATKVYNTIEGGALVCHDEKTKKRIDYLKNFGFAGETEIVAPGINGKMDEIRSAYGLLNLKQVDTAIEARHQIAIKYRKILRNIKGLHFMEDIPGVRHNYSYFPIFVDAEKYGMTRDELYFKMKEQNVFGRRYFYPLISEFSTYRGLDIPTIKHIVFFYFKI